MTNTLKNYGPQQALNPANFIRQNAEGLGLTTEDLKVSFETIIPLPKGAAGTPTLVRASKKYIVPFNGKFYSYPMVLVDHPTSRDLLKIQAPIPNILREGMVVVGGEVLFVKLEDLKRGIVRKSRKLPIPPKRTITYKDFIDGLACTQSADLPVDHYYSTASVVKRRAALDAAAGCSPTPGPEEAGAPVDLLPRGDEGSIDLDEESRLINLAFQEQVGSLYCDPNEEEDWQDEDDSQS
jgi:hypothetical protein